MITGIFDIPKLYYYFTNILESGVGYESHLERDCNRGE